MRTKCADQSLPAYEEIITEKKGKFSRAQVNTKTIPRHITQWAKRRHITPRQATPQPLHATQHAAALPHNSTRCHAVPCRAPCIVWHLMAAILLPGHLVWHGCHAMPCHAMPHMKSHHIKTKLHCTLLHRCMASCRAELHRTALQFTTNASPPTHHIADPPNPNPNPHPVRSTLSHPTGRELRL